MGRRNAVTYGPDEIELHLTRAFPQVTGGFVDRCGLLCTMDSGGRKKVTVDTGII